MARSFLASTLPERSLVAFFTTIILAVRGSCWGPSLGISPGPGLPLARSTSSAAPGCCALLIVSRQYGGRHQPYAVPAKLAGAMSRTQYLAGGTCGRGRHDAVVAFVC